MYSPQENFYLKMPTTYNLPSTLKYYFFAFGLLLLGQSSIAQLSVTADQPDAYYEAGQAMNFIISGGSGTATYEIRYDRGHTPPITQGTVTVTGGIGYIPFILNEPGMVFCEVTLNGQNAICGAAFSPFEIQPYEADPADFDSFWQGLKNQLAAVPINPVLTPLFPDPNMQTTDYRINLGFIDGRRVYGYLSIPPGAGTFPAVITMASHGGLPNLCIPRTQMAIETGAISLSIWMHNAEPDQTPTSAAYWPEIYDDPNQNYYRYGPLAIIRAIDYIETMPEFNGQKIGLSGNSEGGGMSILAAGIDNRIDMVAASLFSMSEHTGLKYNKASGFPYFLNRSTYTWPPTINESIVNATKYYDALRSAKRFDGPFMSLTNYRDETIMPATNLVAYNQLKGSTVLIHNIVGGHTSIPAFVNGKFDFFRKHLNSGSGNTGYFADAGQDVINAGSAVSLSGKVEFNGVENFSYPIEWEKVSGPGQVVFADKNARNTMATFTTAGEYILRFRATDQSPLAQNSYYYTITDHIKITTSGLGDPCSVFGGDADGDGACANIDCNDNDPTIGAPGDSCDDGDPTTTNDQIQSNCTCVGTLPPCASQGGDADNDGVCANTDCDDNNPNISHPGDSCDDGDPSTANDEIQSDCTCVGVSNSCNVTWTISGSTITLNNFVAPYRIFKLLNDNFVTVYECNDWTSTNMCGVNEAFTVPSTGNYWIQIQTTVDFTNNVCNIFEQITFTANPCQNAGGDNDGDGACANVDCDDNDPTITLSGTACDDGNPSTQNDILQSDCSCAGTTIPCINNGGDTDGDGVCDDIDCDINDPFISQPGDACDDGNPATTNDVIVMDCTCQGQLPCLLNGGDADGDGVCADMDCDDNDATIGATGDTCDDGNPLTSNDIIQSDCSCLGTLPCANNGGDADGDGFCADVDCDDNDQFVSSPNDACDDGDPNTSNDVIQTDCSCVGTPPLCFNNGGDTDADGICADLDCDDNDANITLPGTPCNDGDPNSTGDEVQSDCTCLGVSNTCNVNWTISDFTITLQNFNAPIKIFKVLDNNFVALYECNDWGNNLCSLGESFTVAGAGTYWLQVQTFNDAAGQICNIFELITVNANPCLNNGGDADADGFCADVDCDDNDPTIGSAGESCDDGDLNTINDILDANCNCAGTFDPCAANGGDADGDGVCTNVDCDDSNPFISVPGDLCDDGNPLTENDSIQIDCSCLGTPIPDCQNNVTDGGTISGDETLCPDDDPTPITNLTFPAGSGTIEYLWLQSTNGCPLNLSDSIPGAHQSAYDPELLSQTTFYRRLSRISGCIDWFAGESNCVVKTIDNTDCGPPNQCNVTWSLNGNQLVVSGLNFPINALQLADLDFNHIYVCNDWSNPCQSTETIPISGGTYYLSIQTYLDWSTEVCHIFDQVNVPFFRADNQVQNESLQKEKLFELTNTSEVSAESVTVYPNPAKDVLYVNIPNFENRKTELRLVNLLGEYMKTSPVQNSENVLEVDLNNISNGIYLLWILPEGEQPVCKKLKVSR